MKTLHLNRYTLPELALEALPAWLDEQGEQFNTIDTVNWADYPYRPDVRFRIAATDRGFVINYRVSEKSVAAVAEGDCGRVWEDSCVEFFSCPNPADGIYYNIECNCVGTVLVAAGADRHERQRAPKEVLDGIERWSSLGRENFSERKGDVSWEVVLLVPYNVYFKHDVKDAPARFTANFYKCGDLLETPHFLSWNPIGVEKPDFHRPEFFGNVEA